MHVNKLEKLYFLRFKILIYLYFINYVRQNSVAEINKPYIHLDTDTVFNQVQVKLHH